MMKTCLGVAIILMIIGIILSATYHLGYSAGKSANGSVATLVLIDRTGSSSQYYCTGGGSQ